MANLKEFSDYANAKGVQSGLCTQSQLTPAKSGTWQTLRDFEKEVKDGGVRTLKTDVAWVGSGYSFGLNGTKTAYNTITETKSRPNIISLDGWAGSQRYVSIWSGDQYGGNWEYIRFHIPTYIGQGLSGNPNIGSDMDGIFSGALIIATRDYQWKAFTPQILDMDGWGSLAKKPYYSGDPYTAINRMYLKLKSELMPYSYTAAHAATGRNNTSGKPMVRAMFLEYPDDQYAKSKDLQYQYMYGDNFLVAPIYKETAANGTGDDIRNNIYLPDENETWIDYFSGKQYCGNMTLNNYDAPLWKLPLFVKNGSIVPMYEENNNSSPKSSVNEKGLDKTKRRVEFWPSTKETSYDLYEDDGMSMENNKTTDSEYGTIENVSYGPSVATKFTSKVENQVATLTANASTGSYN